MPILVVEDNEPHAYAIRRMLEHAGFAVLPADTVNAACLLARAKHPSLILLDIHLPDGDGFQVFNLLRADPATSDIPIVFYSSATPSNVFRSQVDALGAEGFLTYPIEASDLIAVVRGATKKRPPLRLK